jgi:hypothetical protein
MKRKPKIINLYLKAYFIFILLVVSFLASIFVYSASFYVHEGGHITYGFLGNFIEDGTITKFTIENWVDAPILKFIKLPQRTKIIEGTGSANFALGGVIMVILVSIFFAFSYYKLSKSKNKKYVFLIPIVFAIHEISGNIICGTDNFIGLPLSICGSFFHFLTKSSIWLITGAFMILFYHGLKDKFKIFFRIKDF